jgi:hypothetical protein
MDKKVANKKVANKKVATRQKQLLFHRRCRLQKIARASKKSQR